MSKKNKLEKVNKFLDLICHYAEMHGIRVSFIILFLVSFIYLIFFGKGIFFYQENKSLFIYSIDYFEKFLARPGGLLVYAGNFLTQGYFNILYGSLINSILLVLISLVIRAVLKHITCPGSFTIIWIFLPSVIILLCQVNYEYIIHQTLGFLSAAGWFLMTITSNSRSRRLVFLLLFPLLYFLLGAYALIFAGMYLIYSLTNKKGATRYIHAFVILAFSVLTVVLFYTIIFLQPLKIILSYPMILYADSNLNPLLITLAVIFILYPVLIKIPESVRSERYRGLISGSSVILIFTLAICLLAAMHNTSIERIFKIEKMVYRQEWDPVISFFEKDPSDNIIEQYYYNLALSEKGLLCERMFYSPQSSGPMSLSLEGNRSQSFRTIYYYYAIGLVNEAHHLAFELMVQHGYTPENIKMLIKTELINNNFSVAERYLTVLSKTLHYRTWAKKYMGLLYKPELIMADQELGEKIRLMPVDDFFIQSDDAKNIDLFLESNPCNRKAFEYKAARLLLEKDIIAVTQEAKKMKSMGYISIPRHIDEAVVAFRNFSRDSADLGGLSSEPGTEERFTSYQHIINYYKGDRTLIEKSLKKSEKNTFWYYLQFGTIKRDIIRNEPIDNSIY
jgi:hypothetical protein